MSVNEAYNVLNRQISRPNYSQLPVTYGQQYNYEHQVDCDQPYGDIYPITMILDSQDRNTEKEEPGYYTIHLNETLKNVHSIELTGGKMANPCYNITEKNNLLLFQDTVEQMENNTCYTIIVPPGDYGPSALATTLTNLMNQIGQNTYQVKIDNTTKKYTFISNNDNGSDIFNLIFTDRSSRMEDHAYIDNTYTSQDCFGKNIKFDVKNIEVGCKKRIYLKNSIAKLLGFKPINLCGELSYTGQYCYNLNPLNYLALFINDYDRIHSVNPKVNGAFCVVNLDDSCCYFDVATRNVDNVRYIKHFYPPIKEVNKFTVKFVDPNGDIFDFQGKDTLLVLEIGCSYGQPILRSNLQREPPKWRK